MNIILLYYHVVTLNIIIIMSISCILTLHNIIQCTICNPVILQSYYLVIYLFCLFTLSNIVTQIYVLTQ